MSTGVSQTSLNLASCSHSLPATGTKVQRQIPTLVVLSATPCTCCIQAQLSLRSRRVLAAALLTGTKLFCRFHQLSKEFTHKLDSFFFSRANIPCTARRLENLDARDRDFYFKLLPSKQHAWLDYILRIDTDRGDVLFTVVYSTFIHDFVPPLPIPCRNTVSDLSHQQRFPRHKVSQCFIIHSTWKLRTTNMRMYCNLWKRYPENKI